MGRKGFVVSVLLALSACFPQEEPASILDTGPRFPDIEGVVTDVSFERLVLDGDRTHLIDTDVESFTTRGHSVTPLLSWKNKYVHVGLGEDGAILWIAGIGIVSGDPPRVIYTGIFERVARGRAVFKDGTTLRLAGGVKPSPRGRETVATIDPAEDVVVALTEQPAPGPSA